MSTDSFTAWYAASMADEAREDAEAGHEKAITVIRQAARFYPAPATQELIAIGDTPEERRDAVETFAYMNCVEPYTRPDGSYCATLVLPRFRITVLASPVRADRPAPVVTEDEGSDAERLVAA